MVKLGKPNSVIFVLIHLLIVETERSLPLCSLSFSLICAEVISGLFDNNSEKNSQSSDVIFLF